MIRKYIRYFILISSMSVLMLGLSHPYKAMSHGFNIGIDDITISSEINKYDLYRKIQMYSEQHEIEPVDAKVDRIWKAMPGYNGLSVNIKASYKKMKVNREFDKNKIDFEEIPPNIHLEDLESEPIYEATLKNLW